LFKRNLSGVSCRHRRGRMSHLLTDDGRVDTNEFPSTVGNANRADWNTNWKDWKGQ